MILDETSRFSDMFFRINLIYAVNETAKGKLTSKLTSLACWSDVSLYALSRYFGLRQVFSACRPDL